MKIKFMLLVLFVFSGLSSAQDTIFVKTGQVIPAIIVEKNNTEIKYKKFGQPEPAAIYSVFVSDISSIHYKDGIIADYTQAGQPETGSQQGNAIDEAGTMKAMKISFGANADYFNRNESDDIQDLWRALTGDPTSVVGSNPLSFPILLKMGFSLGNPGRHLLGDELQIIITPVDAIYATGNGGKNEIKLRNSYFNIILFYGRTLNFKRTVAIMIEPGLDLSFMSGYIKINDVKHEISGNLGAGFHIATGFDWNMSKRLTASTRFGYRSMKVDESHEDSSSSTGYKTFGTVNWSGPYVSAGLTWSFYVKMKYGNAG